MKNFYLITGCLAISALVSCAHKNQESFLTKSGLNPENFKTEVNGKTTDLYVLTNSQGMEACITNFGGRIVSLMVPDKEGVFQDVVLGHDSIQDYINIDGNFGALIGRYGNRISQGKFTLNGIEYQLPQNNNGHCLHGGPIGFHNSVWDGEQLNDSTLKLTLFSEDGEADFPGNVNIEVIYMLTSDNALNIDYEATTDKPTILNLTNHSYFNLSGDPRRDVLKEILTMDASSFTPIDSTVMTTGEIRPVDGTPFDFRKGMAIGDSINSDYEQIKNGLGYDHNLVLDHSGDINNVAAKLYDPESGIIMKIYTNEPGIQFYAGNFLDGSVKGKKGIAYPHRSGVCLETQHFPDSPNKPNWPSVVINPGETYRSQCIYKFSTEP